MVRDRAAFCPATAAESRPSSRQFPVRERGKDRAAAFRLMARPDMNVCPERSPNQTCVREESMAAKTKFRGSFTALVTPFKNGSVDGAPFPALGNWQISEGTHGLVPVGTTGESPTLNHDEPKQVVEWC